MNLQAILAHMEEAAREAGAYLYEGFSQQKTVDHKSSAIDLVTEYDRGAEEMIVSRLTAVYPHFNLLAEEGSRNRTDSPYTWIIDPLDGTTNFAHGLPHFCVSIALYEGNTPLAGVVHDPVRDECFTAVSGQGAFLQQGRSKQKLQVSTAETLVQSILATGFPYDRHTAAVNNVAQLAAFLKKAQGIRRAGSAALDLAYVAAGRLDGYWEFKLHPWDVAAAHLMVLEAGGLSSDMMDHPLEIREKIGMVASNGRIHRQIIETLAEINS